MDTHSLESKVLEKIVNLEAELRSQISPMIVGPAFAQALLATSITGFKEHKPVETFVKKYDFVSENSLLIESISEVKFAPFTLMHSQYATAASMLSERDFLKTLRQLDSILSPQEKGFLPVYVIANAYNLNNLKKTQLMHSESMALFGSPQKRVAEMTLLGVISKNEIMTAKTIEESAKKLIDKVDCQESAQYGAALSYVLGSSSRFNIAYSVAKKMLCQDAPPQMRASYTTVAAIELRRIAGPPDRF